MKRIRSALLAGAISLSALLITATYLTRQLRPAESIVAAKSEGPFLENGQFPGKPIAHAPGVRLWGSWAGNDDNRGSLTLGPFDARQIVTLAFTGYPRKPGNTLELRLAGTNESIRFVAPFDMGERWTVFDINVPPAWVGKPVTLHAVDNTTGHSGWFGISEPLLGGSASGIGALLHSLAGWTTSGVLLGLLYWAAARELAQRRIVQEHWLPLVAAAVVASCGYLAFWAFFAGPVLGRLFSGALLVTAAYLALRRRPEIRAGRDFATAATMLVAVGFFYLTLLHLYPSSREFYNLAANRFREDLPGDNTLPHNSAMSLYKGDMLRSEGADWLSSDRPPLQSGWQLLTIPVTDALGLDETTTTGTSAVWLQSLWVPAVFGLFRTLGLPLSRAVAWTVLLSINGFFLTNTIFTWPKLSAAAFGCGAFAIWFLRGRHPDSSPDPSRRREVMMGAALAGLAWLSHGGIAFSFLALLPWIAWRLLRGDLRSWACGAAVFLAFALPWFAYQKFYDPPGDRLIKMHLAGQGELTSDSPLVSIRKAYQAKSGREIAAAKLANFEMQTLGRWRGLVEFDRARAPNRRNDEFFSAGRALGWWIAGAMLLPMALGFRGSRQRLAVQPAAQASLLGWTLLTVVIWCLLMFDPYTAMLHQGSYAMMLAAFVLLSIWLEATHRWLIFPVAALQLAGFVATWAGSNATVHGTPTGWPFLLAATVLLASLFFRAVFATERLSDDSNQPRPLQAAAL